MTAVVPEAAVPSLGPRSFTNDWATATRVDFGLRRSLVADVVTDGLYDDLEAVLGEDSRSLSPQNSAEVAARLREAAPNLKDVVERIVKPYPPQMDYVMALSAEHPRPEDTRGHLVRFASSMLTLLDMLGEIAS
ncbi:hypothetical protein ACLQ16_04035 [Streptomyces albidoflavus]|uniref:hypothetical protein n=1 Tax=Streptomyces albidoflavus TaxID=1886 RepID=UPI000A1CC433|nr:hypothetical protein [Streptomyces albidoflavus]